MAATKSTMLELGHQAVAFDLPDVTSAGKNVQLQDFEGKAVLLMFICNHCPFVIHIVDRMTELANHYSDLGVAALAISSNDIVAYPQDGPEKMQEFAKQAGFKFPYLFDESQQVAKDYTAACTPDFFLYDSSHKLVYRGQMDSSRPGNNVEVSGQDLQLALQAVIQNKPVPSEQIPSIGCNIKWQPGNEPSYF